MILKDAIINQIKKDAEYHKNGLRECQAQLKNKETFYLSGKLESIMFSAETPKNVYPTSYGSLTIVFQTFEGARQFVERAMDKLGIEKVKRDMETYSSELKWFYRIQVNNENGTSYYLHVYPAQPTEGCNPTRIAIPRDPQMKWVCEREENHE